MDHTNNQAFETAQVITANAIKFGGIYFSIDAYALGMQLFRFAS